jgi:hypothetical protein
MNTNLIKTRLRKLKQELRKESDEYLRDPEYQEAIRKARRIQRSYAIAGETRVKEIRSEIEGAEDQLRLVHLRNALKRSTPPHLQGAIQELAGLHPEVACYGKLAWTSKKEDWIMIRIRARTEAGIAIRSEFWFFKMFEAGPARNPSVKIQSGENRSTTETTLNKIKEQVERLTEQR